MRRLATYPWPDCKHKGRSVLCFSLKYHFLFPTPPTWCRRLSVEGAFWAQDMGRKPTQISDRERHFRDLSPRLVTTPRKMTVTAGLTKRMKNNNSWFVNSQQSWGTYAVSVGGSMWIQVIWLGFEMWTSMVLSFLHVVKQEISLKRQKNESGTWGTDLGYNGN